MDDDLPGFDEAAARAWVEALDRAAEAPFRPRDQEQALDVHASALELRRLLTLAGPETSSAAQIRLWRELEGVRLARADRLQLAVWGGAQPELTIALARRRFGAAPRLALAATAEQAVAAAHRPGVIAVLPLEGAWWGRLLARPDVRVCAAMHGEADTRRPLALAVASAPLDATGGDRTFWVTDAPGSAAAIETRLGAAGFAADIAAEAGGLKLFALAGYVQAHDARLAQAPGRLTGVIGAAPIGLDP